MRLLIAAFVLVTAAAGGLYWLATPGALPADRLPDHVADPGNGRVMFDAGGCITCHKPGPDVDGADAGLPAGGAPLETPVGTFYPPNLTPDRETGIGGWSDADFVNAMTRGIAPGGVHLFPAFPYTSYRNMRMEDLIDLKAYLDSLTPVKNAAPAVGAPLGLLRVGLGLWQGLAFAEPAFAPDPDRSARWNRGAYLVNGPGHCGQCHTPRNALMVMDASRFLAGGPHPEGEGRVPSLRGLIARGKYKDTDDLASALQYGELFGYDGLSSGGMGAVQTNLSKLPETDIKAIADYLASLQ